MNAAARVHGNGRNIISLLERLKGILEKSQVEIENEQRDKSIKLCANKRALFQLLYIERCERDMCRKCASSMKLEYGNWQFLFHFHWDFKNREKFNYWNQLDVTARGCELSFVGNLRLKSCRWLVQISRNTIRIPRRRASIEGKRGKERQERQEYRNTEKGIVQQEEEEKKHRLEYQPKLSNENLRKNALNEIDWKKAT